MTTLSLGPNNACIQRYNDSVAPAVNKTSEFSKPKSSKINCLSSENPSGGGYLQYSLALAQLAIASAIISPCK